MFVLTRSNPYIFLHFLYERKYSVVRWDYSQLERWETFVFVCVLFSENKRKSHFIVLKK